MEKVRREFREQEERWMKERKELRMRIQELERSMEGREESKLERTVEGGKEVRGQKGAGEVESRIQEIERKMEKREREKRERRS